MRSRDVPVPSPDLAYQVIALERGAMRECVGCQDQALAAVGGFNVLEFRAIDNIVVHRVPLSRERLAEFERHLLLLFTGFRWRARYSGPAGRGTVPAEPRGAQTDATAGGPSYGCLTGNGGLEEFGRLLDEGWRLKQSLDAGGNEPDNPGLL